MAFRLDDLVIAGFFYNSRPFSVHGRLLLRGCEMPVLVELTGDPDEDLRGRGFEFEVPQNDRPPTDEDRERATAFRNQQIGPVGEWTASRKRKTFDCSVEEFYRRSELGEPPPVRWCQSLYLEWFSQNGRVVIELLEPQLRFLENGQAPSGTEELPQEAEDSETEPMPDDASPDSEDPFPPLASSRGAEEESEGAEDTDYGLISESMEAEDEGYGLIPEEFNRDLERSARRLDREIKPPSADGGIEECEMLDDLIEHGEGTPAGKLIDRLRLPTPSADLAEPRARQALNTALMELALFGIAFHICEHCSIQNAYRILIEKVCEECKVFPEMRGTSFVQHFTTSDFCQQCRD